MADQRIASLLKASPEGEGVHPSPIETLRPEDRMRWPLDQILGDAEGPRGKILKYNTAESIRIQAEGTWREKGREVVQAGLDESMRILRDRSGPFKRRLQDEYEQDKKG